MTKTNEMPGVIWFSEWYQEHGAPENFRYGTCHNLKGTDQPSYHHTAALIERLEGMKYSQIKVIRGMLSDDKEAYGAYKEKRGYNAALQDVIDILKGERE